MPGTPFSSTRRGRRLRRPLALLLGAVLPIAGCTDTGNVDLRRQIAELRTQIDEKNTQIESQQAQINELEQQLRVARAISDEDMAILFHPVKIAIDKLSGGENYDSQPGDDGVTVFLRPIDQQGDVLKAAGAMRIELYDLAAPEGQKQLGTWNFPVAQAKDLWYGQLMTQHYTLKCPWKDRRPTGAEITIRATFVDYLTQRVMTDQATCKITLPPPASRP